jgi:hypothetical protein
MDRMHRVLASHAFCQKKVNIEKRYRYLIRSFVPVVHLLNEQL